MSLDTLINILVIVTLIEMMVGVGLGVTLADVAAVAGNWRLAAKAALANYLFVPAAAIALLLLFRPNPMVAAGLLVVVVCPGAPFGPPLTAMAKGNVPVAVGLMVMLAVSSAILAPLLLHGLLPVMAGSERLDIDGTKLVVTLVLTQLAPLCAGLMLRNWRPASALRLQKPANRLSLALNLLVLGLILVAQFHTLLAIRLTGLVGMLGLLSASGVAGWLLGGPGAENRRGMAITTSVRNVGVGLVIVTGSFPGTPAVTAALAYGLLQTVAMALVALAWGRSNAGIPG